MKTLHSFILEADSQDSNSRQDPPDPKTSYDEARALGIKLGVDWGSVDFTVQEFTKGINVEYEHGRESDPDTNVTNDDPIKTAKIALAHLREFPNYYRELAKMEKKLKENE